MQGWFTIGKYYYHSIIPIIPLTLSPPPPIFLAHSLWCPILTFIILNRSILSPRQTSESSNSFANLSPLTLKCRCTHMCKCCLKGGRTFCPARTNLSTCRSLGNLNLSLTGKLVKKNSLYQKGNLRVVET